jgi:hypothetical protein
MSGETREKSSPASSLASPPPPPANLAIRRQRRSQSPRKRRLFPQVVRQQRRTRVSTRDRGGFGSLFAALRSCHRSPRDPSSQRDVPPALPHQCPKITLPPHNQRLVRVLAVAGRDFLALPAPGGDRRQEEGVRHGEEEREERRKGGRGGRRKRKREKEEGEGGGKGREGDRG